MNNSTRSSRLRSRSDNGGNTMAPPQDSSHVANFFAKTGAEPNVDKNETATDVRKRKKSTETIISGALQGTTELTAKRISKSTQSRCNAPASISKFFQPNDDDDDFEIPSKPRVVRPPPPPPKRRAVTKKASTRPKKSSKIISQYFSDAVTEHSARDGLDPDHLQMALALSKSIIETSGPGKIGRPTDHAMNTAAIFQKFGLKLPTGSETDIVSLFDPPKGRKKHNWAMRFTALTRRNAGIEEKKIEARARYVLTKFGDNLCVQEPLKECKRFVISSQMLGKFYVPEKILFRLNDAANEADADEFYTADLFEMSTAQCGCLLKDWSAIPGRDSTPERAKLIVEKMQENCEIFPSEMIVTEDVLSSPAPIVINSQSTVEPSQFVRAPSPDIFTYSDDEMCMSVVLAPETPRQSFEMLEPIPSGSSSNAFLDASDSIVIPSSSDTLPSDRTVLDDGMSDESEELPPPTACPSKQDEEEERLVNLYHQVADIGPDALCNKSNRSIDASEKSDQHQESSICLSSGSSEEQRIDSMEMNTSGGTQEDLNLAVGSFVSHCESGIKVFEEFISDEEKTDTAVAPVLQSQRATEVIEISDDDIATPASSPITNTGNLKSREYSPSADISQTLCCPSKRPNDLETSHKSTDEIDFSFKSINIQSTNNDVVEDDELISQTDDSMSIDSLVISDDEINYSMNWTKHKLRKSKISPRSDDRPPASCASDTEQWCGSKDDSFRETAELERSQRIFDEEYSVNPIITSPRRSDSSIEMDVVIDERMVDRCVRDIFEKDFVTNTAASGTKLTRTTSDVRLLETHKRPSSSKFRAFLDDSLVGDGEIDEFDRLVYGAIVTSRSDLDDGVIDNISKTTPTIAESIVESNERSSATDTPQEFDVEHLDRVCHVKFGPNVSPKPNYEAMDTPTRLLELRRYGLKALPKLKAVICLEHIYNRMHPYIEAESGLLKLTIFDTKSLVDRHDTSIDLESLEIQSNDDVVASVPLASQAMDLEKLGTQSTTKTITLNLTNSIGPNILDHKFLPFIAEQSQYFLPSQPRKKIPWCLQPLHVAWYNILRVNPILFETILHYEPIDLNQIRGCFKELGMLFVVNDLIAFFDKHCITYRMENQRNKKP